MAKTEKREKPKLSKDSNALKVVSLNHSRRNPNKASVGGARGIESMFRNAYRAQLDMIALAATKANIMISLNGFLVSMLLVSGAYLLASDTLLLIPVTAFLLTCTVSIIFAVLAARPDVEKSPKSLEEFREEKADILIFQQFASLSPDEFDTAMWEMLQDNDRVYRSMTAHIYNMGKIADKKFHRLHISYNTFMVGLTASVLILIMVLTYHVMTGANAI